ncbi:MAG TPA: hypothetical protein VLQ67_00015, partial [Arachnia sp.]|nr:hypothetical protein [Arachnia sp.]
MVADQMEANAALSLAQTCSSPEVLEHVHERLATTVGPEVPVLLHSTATHHQHHRDMLRHHLRQLDASHQAAIDGLTVYRASQLTEDCTTYLTLSLRAAASTREAITHLQEALDAEQLRLPSLREQAFAQLRPLKSAIETASRRNLAP